MHSKSFLNRSGIEGTRIACLQLAIVEFLLLANCNELISYLLWKPLFF